MSNKQFLVGRSTDTMKLLKIAFLELIIDFSIKIELYLRVRQKLRG